VTGGRSDRRARPQRPRMLPQRCFLAPLTTACVFGLENGKAPLPGPLPYRGDRTRTCNPRFWSQMLVRLRGGQPAISSGFGHSGAAQIISVGYRFGYRFRASQSSTTLARRRATSLISSGAVRQRPLQARSSARYSAGCSSTTTRPPLFTVSVLYGRRPPLAGR
jgi:hypothetical protein